MTGWIFCSLLLLLKSSIAYEIDQPFVWPGLSENVPEYEIATNGTALTVTREDVIPQCVPMYTNQLDRESKVISGRMNALIGTQFCPSVNLGDVVVQSVLTTMQITGHRAALRIDYNMDFSPSLNFLSIVECTSELTTYILDGESWPDPIIAGGSGCVALELVPKYFDNIGPEWTCIDLNSDVEESARFNILLLYQVIVGSIMRTEDNSTLSTDCTINYGYELSAQNKEMVARLQMMLDNEQICRHNIVDELLPSQAFGALNYRVFFTVTFILRPTNEVSFNDFMECVDEIHAYTSDLSNWEDPFLPPPTGCPLLVMESDSLGDEHSRWTCLQWS